MAMTGRMRRLRQLVGNGEDGGPLLSSERGLQDAYDRYGGELFAFALNSLRDRGLAEDVVQDTFVRAWRFARRYDPAKGSLRTWLYAIARNSLADVLGRRAASAGGLAVDEVSAEPMVDDEVERLLSSIQLEEALNRLTADHRQAIVEVYYHGRTCAEVAAGLGIPAATMRSRLYYGVRSLRLILEESGWLA